MINAEKTKSKADFCDYEMTMFSTHSNHFGSHTYCSIQCKARTASASCRAHIKEKGLHFIEGPFCFECNLSSLLKVTLFCFVVLLQFSWRRGSKDARGQGFKCLFSKDFISVFNLLSISAMSFFSVPNSPFSIKFKSPANNIAFPIRKQNHKICKAS